MGFFRISGVNNYIAGALLILVCWLCMHLGLQYIF